MLESGECNETPLRGFPPYPRKLIFWGPRSSRRARNESDARAALPEEHQKNCGLKSFGFSFYLRCFLPLLRRWRSALRAFLRSVLLTVLTVGLAGKIWKSASSKLSASSIWPALSTEDRAARVNSVSTALSRAASSTGWAWKRVRITS